MWTLANRVRTRQGRAAAAKLGLVIRGLQAPLLRTPQMRRTGCGLRAPRLRVSRRLHPARDRLPALGGAARPVARLGSPSGGSDFVANELIVKTGDAAALRTFLARWDGKVLRSTGPRGAEVVHLVRIDTSRARLADLSADLRSLDPLARGDHDVSSRQGLGLIAAAADEAQRGTAVGMNFIATPHSISDRKVAEGATLADPNPFAWTYMRTGGTQNIGAAEAWRVLEGAGKLGNRVKVAVIDGGFSNTQDLDPAWPGQNGAPNSGSCGGGPCPWHGTNTASTVGARVDNGFGTAGAAGPVADLVMVQAGVDMFDNIDGIYAAFDAKAKIINMSLGYEIDAAVSWAQVPIEDATQSARERGILVVASAGNEGRDVDAEDCFIACWEEEWIAPCENDGVVCVGGIDWDSTARAPSSNYGFEWCGQAPCDVDIFGPWSVYVGPDPANANPRRVSGTSFSAPFVAGVAALIWAADPTLSVSEVESILLNTAHSGDARVGRYVDALAAVRAVIPNQPPFVTITEPLAGASFSFGGLNLINLTASATDPEDGNACCVISWSSDADGSIGVGKTVLFALPGPGPRTLTATATDSKGGTAHTTVPVTGVNDMPNVRLDFPGTGGTVYRGLPYTFLATATDKNEQIDCARMTWSVTRSGVQQIAGSGCQFPVTAGQNGSWSVEVRYTDGQGWAASTFRGFSVVDPPVNSPPISGITSPTTNLLKLWNETFTLTGTISDPDGTGPITYRWLARVTSGLQSGKQFVLATPPMVFAAIVNPTPSASWSPSSTGLSFSASCSGTADVTIVLEATDPHGTSETTVPVKVMEPAC